MGLAVVTVASGGLPIVESTIGGTPVTEAANGRGVPVTKVVGKPGLPVVFETIGVGPGVTYATLDGATAAAVILSNGNLTVTGTSTVLTEQGAHVAAVLSKSTGKYYVEYKIENVGSGGTYRAVGIGVPTETYANMGNTALSGAMLYMGSGNIWSNGASVGISLGVRATNDVIGLAGDLDNRKVWFRIAPTGNWNGNVANNPATNVGGVTLESGTMVPFCTFGNGGSVAAVSYTGNFGASAFVGAVPAGFTSGWPA